MPGALPHLVIDLIYFFPFLYNTDTIKELNHSIVDIHYLFSKILIMKKIFTFLLFAVLLPATYTKANNIQLANVVLNGQNTAGQYSIVNFDVSWENSWRLITNQANYDGAWIFVKFRKVSGSTWQHATINTTGYTAPTGSILQTSLDGKGVWIYHVLPSADFAGNVNYTGAKIRWNYGADGVLNTDSVEIKVFALEMVYIPTGAYELGTGGNEENHFSHATGNTPFSVTAENAQITIDNNINPFNSPTALYYCNCDGNGGDQLGPIPAAFPKGYNASWIMKYECSTQQYVDFLNNLDGTSANNRNPSEGDQHTGWPRTFFTGIQPSLVAIDPAWAMSGLSCADLLAFADWAGLRPFTELEYEKACRGTQPAVPNEYPWGNSTITLDTAGVLNQGLENEIAIEGNTNALKDDGNTERGLYTPSRTGMFATATSSRTSSGSTYYGAMDMCGNAGEFCITIGSPEGRAFTAANGDGNLDVNGNANVLTWPNVFQGFLEKGGDFLSYPTPVSYRSIFIIGVDFSYRVPSIGIRLARTAE